MSSYPKISVIIPIYNTAKYLNQCLDSVANQTLNDIEIICVDDGSTDKSLEIVSDYAKSDKRIKIIKQKNQGTAVARNKAMKVARGEFLAFIDSDDWYPDLLSLEKLYKVAKDNKVKIAGGSFSEYDSNTGEVVTDYTDRGHLEAYQFKSEGIIKYKDWQSDLGWIRFIYNRKMILDNDIYFPKLTRHEDPVFLVNAMVAAKKFYAITDVVYRYRIFYKSMDLSDKNIDDAVSGIIMNLMTADKNKLDTVKKWSIESLMWYATLSPKYRQVVNDNNKVKQENDKLCQQIADLKKKIEDKNVDIQNITNSKSFKVGRIVTSPVRLMRKLTSWR